MRRDGFFSMVLPVLAVLVLACTLGCGGSSADFRAKEAGLEMDLPAGWSQGAPKMAGGFHANRDGMYFFADRAKDFPRGSVMLFELEGESLLAHAEKVIEQEKAMTGMFKAMVGFTGKVAGPEADEPVREAQASLETGITGPEEVSVDGRTAYAATFKTPDLLTRRLFIARGDEVIEVIFQAETPEWPKYEAAFREMEASIRLD